MTLAELEKKEAELWAKVQELQNQLDQIKMEWSIIYRELNREKLKEEIRNETSQSKPANA